MIYFSRRLKSVGKLAAFGLQFADPDKQDGTRVWEARSLDDFRRATRIMRQASRTTICPIDPARIGRLLSMLNHGGSGPGTGCLLLAAKGDSSTGFALLLVRPKAGLELSWLHVAKPNLQNGVIEKLWDHAVRTQRDWGFEKLRVGNCTNLPHPTSQLSTRCRSTPV